MSLQDIAKKMADDFQAEILRFADQKKTRRVYVAKWRELGYTVFQPAEGYF